ncbi:MAG TPA: DUF302 domain-containing protein [Gammaproteobacteria bacterium]|nr:DUF302 domain-containing protein [Gammaproteobacteria bacterium]
MKKLLMLWLLLVSPVSFAEDLFMARSQLPFPEAMSVLQQAVRENGYTVSRVQRVDIGLTKMGYKTDKYRVVFFGNLDELHAITDQYPDLVPYLPLKIAIFAENGETILLASSFKHLRPFYMEPALQARFDQWEKAIRAILDQVRLAE